MLCALSHEVASQDKEVLHITAALAVTGPAGSPIAFAEGYAELSMVSALNSLGQVVNDNHPHNL